MAYNKHPVIHRRTKKGYLRFCHGFRIILLMSQASKVTARMVLNIKITITATTTTTIVVIFIIIISSNNNINILMI